LKNHAGGPWTTANIPQLFYNYQDEIHKKKKFKKTIYSVFDIMAVEGYVTAQALNACWPPYFFKSTYEYKGFSKLHGVDFDHQFYSLFCDPSIGSKEDMFRGASKLAKRCLFGKDSY
jgi:hypothetical protein